MWKGVIIEQSLESKDILRLVRIVKTKTATLEREEEKGEFHFHNVQVGDDNIDRAVAKAKAAIKNGWYMHFCKDNTMIVIFRGKSFVHQKGDEKTLDAIRKYGVSIGINSAQLPDDGLIDRPWD